MTNETATKIIEAQRLHDRKVNAVNAIAPGATLRYQAEKWTELTKARRALKALLDSEPDSNLNGILRIHDGRILHTFIRDLNGDWGHSQRIL